MNLASDLISYDEKVRLSKTTEQFENVMIKFPVKYLLFGLQVEEMVWFFAFVIRMVCVLRRVLLLYGTLFWLYNERVFPR